MTDADDTVLLSIFDSRHSALGHSDFRFADAYARRGRVLFVNSIGFAGAAGARASRFFHRVLRRAAGAIGIGTRTTTWNPAVDVLTPPFFPTHRGLLARFLHARLARSVRQRIEQRGLLPRRWIVTNPLFLPLLEALGAGPIVYNRSDAHSAFPVRDGEVLRRCEAGLLARADVVAYASNRLFAAESAALNGRGLLLGHGIDGERFRRDVPPDAAVAALPRPIFGFLGTMRWHAVDFELVRKLAAAVPHGTVLMVGAWPDGLPPGGLPGNVVRPGPRDHQQIPAMLAAIDVAILPYRATQWVAGCQPIKLLEAVAMGRPVVAKNVVAPAEISLVETVTSDDEFVARAIAWGHAPPASPAAPLPSWDELTRRLDERLAAL